MLQKLGHTMARRRTAVVVVWVVLFVVIAIVESVHHGGEVNIFSIPGASSQKATNLLETAFPSASGTTAQVVFEAPSGALTDSGYATALTNTAEQLSHIPTAGPVNSPTKSSVVGVAAQGPKFGYPDLNAQGNIGYSTVQFATTPTNADGWTTLYHQIQDATKTATDAGITVRVGGQVADIADPPPPGISQYSEEIGILMAVVILLVALRSALAMTIPIAVGVVAVLTSANIVNILTANFTINSVAPVLGSMIGLGVGIDYTLFIVSRYRQNLEDGMQIEDALGNALKTSGSAVIFAGITVCVALCGLAIIGIPYVTQMGVVAAMYVVITMLTALTLGPAILAFCGARVNKGRMYRRHLQKAGEPTLSSRWAEATARRPALYAVIAIVVLAALAIPLFSIQLGFTDDGNLPAASQERQAFDLLASNFGPGINSPLIIAAELPAITPQNSASLLVGVGNLFTGVNKTSGVKNASLPIPNRTLPFKLRPGAPQGSTSPADYTYDYSPNLQPTALIMRVIPTTSPNAAATSQLVTNLRNNVVPGALVGTALPVSQVFVGGATAIQIDLADVITSKLIFFIGAVVILAMLLLMAVFRSVLIPVTAAVMNVLSIGAAYGVIVLVFQHGIGSSLIGLPNPVPIVAFVPVMMFAILFGLSMDYEVFLLSRIREEYERTGNPTTCVTAGVTQTARVITAAASIMIFVFLSFVPNPDATVKMIGFGMAASVLFDASIVRMMLVPATMELSGRANWWFPAFLEKVLPKITVA